jgi:hypothetical protein
LIGWNAHEIRAGGFYTNLYVKLQTPYFQGFWGLGFGKILNWYLKGEIKRAGIMCERLFGVKANT